ncbi:hypothetical protein ACFIJ5_16220 [Haloimpatiens sp. FM7330]|uniref:hypothetical protein n=1 Tax=Haloimpatiens sp. FM7330 TaxID=3298610 RepID=UPI003641FB97
MRRMKGIGVLSAIIGMILYRIMSYYYGDSGPKLAAYIAISIFLLCIISLVLMKYFLVAFLLIIIILPEAIIVIGMHFDNILVVITGIVLLLIMIPIMIKVTPYLTKYKK